LAHPNQIFNEVIHPGTTYSHMRMLNFQRHNIVCFMDHSNQTFQEVTNHSTTYSQDEHV